MLFFSIEKKFLLCVILLSAMFMQGAELELASWRKYLVNGGVQTQCDYLLQLMKEMEQNDGKAKGLSEKEMDAVIDWCAEDLKVFPWGKYTETKELTKDDPLNSASMKLYFLLFTNELNLPRAIAFADYVEKGSGVSEELRKNWFRQSRGCLRVVSAAKVWDKRFKNKGGVSKDEFVKVVLDKTYMGRGYPYFGSFLHEKDNRKERIAELRNDKETLAKVIQSLTEDFPEGNKLLKPVDPMQLRRFPRSLQMHILDAVKSLLTLEEQYYWFKENVGKPGILENYKEEMEQFIAGYAAELEAQRKRPTVEKFVKVVLDKTYLSDHADYQIFDGFLFDKGLVADLQDDKALLEKVMESLTEDLRLGYKNLKGEYRYQEESESVKVNRLQYYVMKAAKTLLTREELYVWFKKNIDNPGILEPHKVEMKRFIADYEGE